MHSLCCCCGFYWKCNSHSATWHMCVPHAILWWLPHKSEQTKCHIIQIESKQCCLHARHMHPNSNQRNDKTFSLSWDNNNIILNRDDRFDGSNRNSDHRSSLSQQWEPASQQWTHVTPLYANQCRRIAQTYRKHFSICLKIEVPAEPAAQHTHYGF